MRILDSKSIEYKLVDISQGEEVRDEMRNKSGNPTAVPPQLFNEDQYCGVRIRIKIIIKVHRNAETSTFTSFASAAFFKRCANTACSVGLPSVMSQRALRPLLLLALFPPLE